MNERIKELANQSQKYAIEWLDETGELHNYYDVYFEKFAELIITDCDRYARSTWEHGHLLGGDLKRLFGFEE
jgi:hypothetical protein